ncbi:unnamed protein product [Schistosoma margrebowiei]|uniref:Uncharacterized protein n=1 Tax=Schistosoma margrebowiei TaxID=48269 RepID=A0A183M632_9TREM|nr:unnamed protein product [Schistosoma margrebowiei]
MKRTVSHAQVSQWEAIKKKKKAREKTEAEIRRLESIRDADPFTHPNPNNDYLQQNINILKRSLQQPADIDDEPHWFTKRTRSELGWSPITAEETDEVLRLLDNVRTTPPDEPVASTSSQNIINIPQELGSDDKVAEYFQDIPIDHDEGEELWTIVYKGPPPKFVKGHRVNTIIINHVDHYHFVFQTSMKNRFRTVRNILQAGNISCDAGATLQPIKNWHAFMRYLVRKADYSAELIGTKLKRFFDQLLLVTPSDQDCSVFMRENRRENKPSHNTRVQCGEHLMDLVTLYNVTHLQQLKMKLSAKDRLNLYYEYGKQWEETAQLCIDVYNETNIKQQMCVPWVTWVSTNHHMSSCTHPSDYTLSNQWFETFFAANEINPKQFLNDIQTIIDKTKLRVNTFCLEGPTTTGKTLILKLIVQNYTYGTVQRSGDHSQFFLQNLNNKSVALMEEPRITPITVNDFKELLGGSPFDIHITHQPDVTLPRIPVLISTNSNLGTYINSIDKDAIYKRCITYHLTKQIGLHVPEPPTQFCACHLYGFFRQTFTDGGG